MAASKLGRHHFEPAARLGGTAAAWVNAHRRLVRRVVAGSECSHPRTATALGKHWDEQGEGHQGGAGGENAETLEEKAQEIVCCFLEG